MRTPKCWSLPWNVGVTVRDITMHGVGSVLLLCLLPGCASLNRSAHFDEGFTPEWSVKLDVQDMSIVDVAPDGRQVMVTSRPGDRNLQVLSGANGRQVWRERESLGSRLLRGGINVGGFTAADFQPDSYQYARLESAGVVLIFDYSLTSDVIRARDMTSGRELWELRDHPWTREKYGSAVASVAGRLLGAGQVGAAAATGVVGGAMTTAISISDLLVPLPRVDGFLFKHLGGLACFDALTGKKRWEINSFKGGGIRDVTELPDGDLIITSRYVGLLDGLGDPHHIARVDPHSGAVRWLVAYSVDGWQSVEYELPTHVEVHGNRLLVHRVHTQIFDIDTGALIYRHLAFPLPDGERKFVVADGVFYAVVNPVLEDPPVIAVYINSPLPTYLRAVDLAAGTVRWESEQNRSHIFGVGIAGDRLVVAASGAIMGGGNGILAFDRADGRLRWKSADFDQPSLRQQFSLRDRIDGVGRVSNLLIDNGTVYAASATALYALNLTDGSPRFTVNYREKDLGLVHRLYDAGEEILVVSTDGVDLLDRATGSATFNTPRGRITGYVFAGDNLFLRRGHQLSVVRPAARTVVASARTRRPSAMIFGNLWDGIHVSDDGALLFVLDDDGRLARYRLAR
jgi:outer membrane protein assembly factor BamB